MVYQKSVTQYYCFLYSDTVELGCLQWDSNAEHKL